MLDQAHKIGLRVMIDLVINHTAIDSPLTSEHPAWYKRDRKGRIKNPGAWEGDKLITVWGDLAEIDNENSTERDKLWNYWLKLIHYYLDLGFDGFRCDAAYKIPGELWNLLISKARERSPQTAFFAESLGCTIKEVVELAEAGFDYVFNSSKYWDFAEPCADATSGAPNVGSMVAPIARLVPLRKSRRVILRSIPSLRSEFFIAPSPAERQHRSTARTAPAEPVLHHKE